MYVMWHWNVFFYLQVKFWINTYQQVEFLEWNYVIAKEHMIFNGSSCFSFQHFPGLRWNIWMLKKLHENLQTTLQCELKGTLSLKQKKIVRCAVNMKLNLILQKGILSSILLCKHILIARDKLPRRGRTISNYFSLTINEAGVKMQFLTSLMANAFFVK